MRSRDNESQLYLTNIFNVNMIWCFTSLSTLLKSYRDDGRMIMKGSVQWNAVQSWAVFRLQRDSNPELTGPKSGALTILDTRMYLQRKYAQGDYKDWQLFLWILSMYKLRQTSQQLRIKPDSQTLKTKARTHCWVREWFAGFTHSGFMWSLWVLRRRLHSQASRLWNFFHAQLSWAWNLSCL